MSLLNVSGLTRRQGSYFALDGVSFEQERLQKLAIAGETGSGKTTLLKIIAGLAQPDAGEVLFEGKRVQGPLERLIPGHPGIAYLSQQFEMPPHYRVDEILQFENRLADQDAEQLYSLCQISHLLHRGTEQLSGGERQRISLARLLIGAPRLLVLDEPFSNMDLLHKNMLKSVIDDAIAHLNLTCILVSHDPLDTLSWADQIMVLQEGKIAQKGSPEEIYRHPVSEYVAGLFGKYNLITPGEYAALMKKPAASNNKALFLRPEDVQVSPAENGRAKTGGTVGRSSFLGGAYELVVDLPGKALVVRTTNEFRPGEKVSVTLATGSEWYI